MPFHRSSTQLDHYSYPPLEVNCTIYANSVLTQNTDSKLAGITNCKKYARLELASTPDDCGNLWLEVKLYKNNKSLHPTHKIPLRDDALCGLEVGTATRTMLTKRKEFVYLDIMTEDCTCSLHVPKESERTKDLDQWHKGLTTYCGHANAWCIHTFGGIEDMPKNTLVFVHLNRHTMSLVGKEPPVCLTRWPRSEFLKAYQLSQNRNILCVSIQRNCSRDVIQFRTTRSGPIAKDINQWIKSCPTQEPDASQVLDSEDSGYISESAESSSRHMTLRVPSDPHQFRRTVSDPCSESSFEKAHDNDYSHLHRDLVDIKRDEVNQGIPKVTSYENVGHVVRRMTLSGKTTSSFDQCDQHDQQARWSQINSRSLDIPTTKAVAADPPPPALPPRRRSSGSPCLTNFSHEIRVKGDCPPFCPCECTSIPSSPVRKYINTDCSDASVKADPVKEKESPPPLPPKNLTYFKPRRQSSTEPLKAERILPMSTAEVSNRPHSSLGISSDVTGGGNVEFVLDEIYKQKVKGWMDGKKTPADPATCVGQSNQPRVHIEGPQSCYQTTSLAKDVKHNDIYDINKLVMKLGKEGVENILHDVVSGFMNERHGSLKQSWEIPQRKCQGDLREKTKAYTDVSYTLHRVLERRPPGEDTLKLCPELRKQLCCRLYSNNPYVNDWTILADVVGLKQEAVSVIKGFVAVQHVEVTAAEIVLRYWQFCHNRGYYRGDQGNPSCLDLMVAPCTKEGLIHILRDELHRHDLVALVTDPRSCQCAGGDQIHRRHTEPVTKHCFVNDVKGDKSAHTVTVYA